MTHKYGDVVREKPDRTTTLNQVYKTAWLVLSSDANGVRLMGHPFPIAAEDLEPCAPSLLHDYEKSEYEVAKNFSSTRYSE